jgi:soluble lytic murein transglycosylase
MLFIFLMNIVWAQNSAEAFFSDKIRTAYQENNPTQIIELIEVELLSKKTHPHQNALLLAKATTLVKKSPNEDEKKQAHDIFRDILNAKTYLSEFAFLQEGILFYKEGNFKEAAKNFQQVEASDPNQKNRWEAQLYLARILMKENKHKEALSHLMILEKKLKGQDLYLETLVELARVERNLKNRTQFCLQIQKIFERPTDLEEMQSWGPILEKNKFDGELLTCHADYEMLKDRIKNFLWAGLVEKAQGEIEVLKKEWDGKDPYNLDRLQSMLYVHEGEMSQALDILKKYEEKSKNNQQFLMTYANAAARAGEMKIASDYYLKSFQAGSKTGLGKESLYQAAFVSYQGQNYEDAEKYFKDFVKLYPQSALVKESHWYLAWMKYLKKNYTESLQLFTDSQKIKGRKSHHPERIRYWTAMTYLRLAQTSKAKVIFKELGSDPHFGFYSILSKLRLKELEKSSKAENFVGLNEGETTNNEENAQDRIEAPVKITRFIASEVMVSNPDVEVVSEEFESEDLISELESDDGSEQIAETQNSLIKSGSVSLDENMNPILMKRLERARELVFVGLDEWAKWDLYDIETKTRDPEILKALSSEYEVMEQYHRSSHVAQISFFSYRSKNPKVSSIETSFKLNTHRGFWVTTYPKAYSSSVFKYASQFVIPADLIWAIMRTESNYKRSAISPVGALGLMQVMPYTGQKISKLLNEKNFQDKKLLESDFAIKYGSKYLQRLMGKYEGNIPLVAASYNAGPHRVQNWLINFGHLETDEFIEHIPYLETRNYVKRVVSNYHIYNHLYSVSPSYLAYLNLPITVKIEKKKVTAENTPSGQSLNINSKENWDDI